MLPKLTLKILLSKKAAAQNNLSRLPIFRQGNICCPLLTAAFYVLQRIDAANKGCKP